MRTVKYIAVAGFLVWLWVPFSPADAACGAAGTAYPRQYCATGTCCDGIACIDTQDIEEAGNDSGVLWRKIPVAKCVDPSVGLTPQSAAQPPVENPLIFTPHVTIPGSIEVGGQQFSVRAGQGFPITGDTIMHYLAVFYRFFTAFLAVAAVTMTTWGGFKRIMAAGSAERIKDANDVIFKAIIGLVLALISYSLLNLINPALTSLKTLDITQVPRIEFDISAETNEEAPPPENLPSTQPGLYVISGDNIINPDNKSASAVLVTSVQAAAAALKAQNVQLFVASGWRTTDEQRALILQNCQNPPGSATCNPKPGRALTCMMKQNNALCPGQTICSLGCPHTSGQAVDVWAAVSGLTPISQAQCMQDKVACRQNPAMAALGQAMNQQGFCNLASEPWHFEKPQMSSTCYQNY